MGVNCTYDDVAKMIDHSLLHPTLTDQELAMGCRTALEHNVASVCIIPHYLRRCVEVLAESAVAAGTTIGFPHGGQGVAAKVREAEDAIGAGAQELDIVVNIGKVLGGDWDYVRREIEAVVDASHSRGAILKVIFENCYLEDFHKIRLCEICGDVGADFIKTSTGYGVSGATMDDLALMCRHAPDGVQVKAAGGIRDLERLLQVRSMGVARVGATCTASILAEFRGRFGD